MSNVQKNDNPSTPSTRETAGIVDIHSHIIYEPRIAGADGQAAGLVERAAFVTHGCEWNRCISPVAA